MCLSADCCAIPCCYSCLCVCKLAQAFVPPGQARPGPGPGPGRQEPHATQDRYTRGKSSLPSTVGMYHPDRHAHRLPPLANPATLCSAPPPTSRPFPTIFSPLHCYSINDKYYMSYEYFFLLMALSAHSRAAGVFTLHEILCAQLCCSSFRSLATHNSLHRLYPSTQNVSKHGQSGALVIGIA